MKVQRHDRFDRSTDEVFLSAGRAVPVVHIANGFVPALALSRTRTSHEQTHDKRRARTTG
jgi:hypothetical protein